MYRPRRRAPFAGWKRTKMRVPMRKKSRPSSAGRRVGRRPRVCTMAIATKAQRSWYVSMVSAGGTSGRKTSTGSA